MKTSSMNMTKKVLKRKQPKFAKKVLHIIFPIAQL